MKSPLALVVGAAGGIGTAVSNSLHRRGFRLVLADRDAEALGRLSAVLPQADCIVLDASLEDEVRRAVEALPESPDVLVNAAGVVAYGELLDVSTQDFLNVIIANLVGPYTVCREAGRRMRDKGGGSIINIGSINALAPSPGTNAYPVAKAGLIALTKLFALELGPHGIRVNSISPGFIDGGMSKAVYASSRARDLRSRAVPLRCLGEPQDIADAVCFLAGPEARYIHGQDLFVDGGIGSSLLAQLPRE